MNNLTQREKVLIYLIVAIVPLFAIFFGFNWFMGKLNDKSVELNAVTRQLAEINLRADLAMDKADLKNQLKQRSLSANENVAQGEYREWLRNLVENEIKFKGTPKVTSRGNVDYKSSYGDKNVIYKQLSFQLDCQGSYKQIVELLYKFYEKNYIHRINRLELNLAKGKRVEGKVTYDRQKFIIKAQIQVLSLVDADDVRSSIAVENTKLFYQDRSQDKLIHQLEEYEAIILRRNVFGFPNNAPEFGSRKKEFDFEEGDRINVRLSADDEDDDELEYMLVSTDGKVKSDQIDQSSSGRFRIDIEKLGTYEFRAEVVDKNYYPKTDDMVVIVKIEEKPPVKPDDPKPDPPKFDPLKFTFLEAIVRNFEGNPIVWINVRPYGQMHKVGDGAQFKVGRTPVEVIKINRRNAVISIDGDQYLFAVNDSLGNPQGELLASTKKADEEKSVANGDSRKTIDVSVKNPNASSSRPEPPSPDLPAKEDKSVDEDEKKELTKDEEAESEKSGEKDKEVAKPDEDSPNKSDKKSDKDSKKEESSERNKTTATPN